MVQLLSGSSLAGPALLKESLPWLLVAVAIKCGALALLQKKLSWRKSVGYMFIANVVSTIPGVLVGALTASLGGFLFALPLVSFLGWLARRRITLIGGVKGNNRITETGAALAFVIFFFISVALFALASNALEGNSFVTYWVLKFLFVAMVAGTGILISAIMEESVIAWLAGKSQSSTSFFPPVLRANYITLGAILLVAAVEMLPRRLHSPNFIVSWVHSLSVALGFA
jgi:hypothetical protein